MTKGERLSGRRCHAIVSTPLQYLNAMELVTALASQECYLVVLEEHYALDFFSRLPQFSRWTDVAAVPAGNPAERPEAAWRRGMKEALIDRRLHRRFIRLLKQWPRAELVVIGNPRELRHLDFAGLAGGRDILVCEDGTASLRRDVGELSLAKRLRQRLLGIDIHWLDGAWWFTAYPEAMGARRHMVNRYDYLRGLLASRRQAAGGGDDIWLLGQPLVELELLSGADYRTLVADVINQIYAGLTLQYWPHPRETVGNLAELAEIPGLDVKRHGQPVELALIAAEVLPQRVATFYSSAYRTCQAIFGDAVPFDVLEPCTANWAEGHHELSILEECYAFYRRDLKRPNSYFQQGRDRRWRELEEIHTRISVSSLSECAVAGEQALR